MEELTYNGSLFQNWVRCAKALNLACEPLAKFVEPANRRLHQSMIRNVTAVPSRTSCSFRNAEKCPRKVCNKLKFEIINAHRFQKPAFTNTELSSCWTDHWELAKCYMSVGYKDIHTATETDFSGFTNLVINNLNFQQELNVNLSDPNNIFIQAREVRNSIMHNSRLQVTPFNMFLYLSVVVRLLEEIKEGLKLHASDKHARELQIENVNFAIYEIRRISSNSVSQEKTHDILLQANLAMRRMRLEIKETIETTSEECRKSLRRTAEISKLDIGITTSVCRKMIEIVGKELIIKLVEQTEKGCRVIESKINQTLEKPDNSAKRKFAVSENGTENFTQEPQVNAKSETRNISFHNTCEVSINSLTKIIGEIRLASNSLPEVGQFLLDKLTNVETHKDSIHNTAKGSKIFLPNVSKEIMRESDILPDVGHYISDKLTDFETNKSPIHNTNEGSKTSLTKIIEEIKHDSSILPEIGHSILYELAEVKTGSIETEFNQSVKPIDTKSVVDDFAKWIEQINQQVSHVPVETKPFFEEAFKVGGESNVGTAYGLKKQMNCRNRKSVPRDLKQPFELDERLEIKSGKGKRIKKMIDVEEYGFKERFNRACVSL